MLCGDLNGKEIQNREDIYIYICMLSHFSHVRLFVTVWTVAHQVPLSIGFSKQEYWSGLPGPPPGIFPTQGLNPSHYVSCIAGGFFTTSATWDVYT